jgi:hypothetical protein
MKRTAWLWAGLLCSVFSVSLTAATDPLYTGCVTQTEAGDFTYCEPAACSVLEGKLVTAKLTGHKVILRGIVHDATPEKPRTIDVTHVEKIGDACDERCSPRPPAHRGIGGTHERPGSEGGTPGKTSQQ